jgi:SagB-type dehydrogenase family enzyme
MELLVSHRRGRFGKARREILWALRRLGEEHPLVERTAVHGIARVRTARDARDVVRGCRRLLLDGFPFEHALKWVPVDYWCERDLEAIRRLLAEKVRGQIAPDETWGMQVEKRDWEGRRTYDLIVDLARAIDRKVDLDHPDRLVRVDVVGEQVAVSVLRPDEIFSLATVGLGPQASTSTPVIRLPPTDELGGVALAEALRRRRSVRGFSRRTLRSSDIGRLAWAAQGITDAAAGLRTAPSAGALYPLELDAVTARGVFRYQPATHTLQRRSSADVRADLARAALGQSWLADTPCVFCVAAVAERTARKYGARAQRYVQLEAGHAAQNLLLAAAALGLGGTPVGAFDDAAVAQALGLDASETPLYLVPVGWPAGARRQPD